MANSLNPDSHPMADIKPLFFRESKTLSPSQRRHPMGVKIYVGGLPYSATDSQLNDLFAPHGTVASAHVITDRTTGQGRGFGFVEMSTEQEAKGAS